MGVPYSETETTAVVRPGIGASPGEATPSWDGVTVSCEHTDGDISLEQFVADVHDRLVGLLFLRCGDHSVAQDLAQDALVKLVENWEDVSQMQHPWRWLAVVASNLSNSRFRRKKVGDRMMSLVGRDRLDEAVAGSENLIALLHTIARMPARQRQALLLRHYVQLSVRETADAMGCAEGTVKSLTSKALTDMRRRLLINQPDDGDGDANQTGGIHTVDNNGVTSTGQTTI